MFLDIVGYYNCTRITNNKNYPRMDPYPYLGTGMLIKYLGMAGLLQCLMLKDCFLGLGMPRG